MPAKKKKFQRGTVSRETPLQEQLKVIGRAFRNGRLDQKLQFKDLAEMSEVSSLTISKLEKAELDNCSLKTMNEIGQALGLKIVVTVVPIN